MRLPPWAIEAIRNGVADVARKASDPETIHKVREQAAELLRDLPENASKSLEGIVKSASSRARDALDQGRDSVLRWVAGETDFGVPCHNVSGRLLNEHGTGLPVSENVLAAGYHLLSGHCLTHDVRETIDRGLAEAVDVEDCRMLVTGSFDAAVHAVSTLADHWELVLHRSQAIELPSGIPLPEALLPAAVKERGGVQRIDPRDFDGIDNACVILADDGNHPIQPIDFQGRSIHSVAILPVATFGDSIDSLPDAKSLLRAGIDLVVLPGGPATGGVAAGILVGKETPMRKLQESRRWNYLQAGDAIAAMTLEALTGPSPTPLAQLVGVSEENLRSRGERLATRLTGDESIATCHITAKPAYLAAETRWKFPSRQVRVRHHNKAADRWAEELRRKRPAVIASADGDDLVVDLRWLPAADDSLVAAALESERPSPNTAE